MRYDQVCKIHVAETRVYEIRGTEAQVLNKQVAEMPDFEIRVL